MKKLYLALIVILVTFVSIQSQSPSPSSIIVNTDGPYYTESTIGFNKTCHDSVRGTSTWDFGDGTIITYPDDNNRGWQYHAYLLPGTYKVKYTHGVAVSTPICGSFSTAPFTVTYVITISPKRAVTASPSNPKVDQSVYFQALNFVTSSVLWNFGDGTQLWGAHYQTHRYQNTGVYTVSVMEKDIKHTPVTSVVTISPDDRFIQLSKSEARVGEPLIVYARNFNGKTILWDFGDGTMLIGGHTISHIYNKPGNYIVKAVDDGGESMKNFELPVKIFGITDNVILEIAELRFDNGKYFMVVPRNSKTLKPLLKLKMRGTGVITGQWLYDGVVYGLINELSRQGEVKEITMNQAQQLPTIEPGVHTVSFKLTKPVVDVTFPILRYYVLPYETSLNTVSPPDGFVAKDDEIPEFSWDQPKGGAAKYQIAFSHSLYDLLNNKSAIKWTDVKGSLAFTPGKDIWDGFKRNRWTYWKVRSFDSLNNVTGESGISEIKVVVATAEITLNKVTSLDGDEITLGKNGIFTGSSMILVNGNIEYKGESEYLILQILVNDVMVDQLLFRDVKKGEVREFETSIPSGKKGKILFRVLKTSSPSVIVGIKGIMLR